MANNNEPGLADAIVGAATSVPTSEQSVATTRGLMSQQNRRTSQEAESDSMGIMDYVNAMLDTIRGSRTPEELPVTAPPTMDSMLYDEGSVTKGEETYGPAERPPEYTPKPRLKGDSGKISLEESATKLQRESGDENFKDSVANLAKKYNITTREIYEMIDGESNWDPTVTNELGYKGLAQIGKVPAQEAGIDYENLTSMTPSEQIKEYDKYLARWDYDGSVPLAVMQAAPGKAKSLKGKSDSSVVYPVDTDPDSPWSNNPGWRSSSTGPITLGSLKNYYRNS